jgi:hypothetical protein
MKARGQLHAQTALPPQKRRQVYTREKIRWPPPSQSGRCGVDRYLLQRPLIESRFSGSPFRSLVAVYFLCFSIVCFTTLLPPSQLHSIEWLIGERWIAKDLDGNSLSLGTILAFAWREREKSRKYSFRIDSSPVEIRNDHLANTSLDCYRCTRLLGVMVLTGPSSQLWILEEEILLIISHFCTVWFTLKKPAINNYFSLNILPMKTKHLCRCGDNSITDDAEICSLRLETQADTYLRSLAFLENPQIV